MDPSLSHREESKEMIERTLILAKPDAIQRGLVGEIIQRFERLSFRISGMKMVHPSESSLGQHYADDPVWKKSVGEKTRASMLKKGVEMQETDEQIGDRIGQWNMNCLREPIIAIVFEGLHAIEAGRKIVGTTEPKTAALGSIRGDYSVDSFPNADKQKRTIRNLCHASGSVEEAEREIAIWFGKDEIHSYEKQTSGLLYGA